MEKIGASKAEDVRHLILEYQIENANKGIGDFKKRLISPKFFKICEHLPKLTRIIFVSHDKGKGSNTLAGDLVFTSLDSSSMSVTAMPGQDSTPFTDWATGYYTACLNQQLKKRKMDNFRPVISFMTPVEASTDKN